MFQKEDPRPSGEGSSLHPHQQLGGVNRWQHSLWVTLAFHFFGALFCSFIASNS